MAVHGEDIRDEIVGISDGTAGQAMAVRRAPVVAAEYPLVVEVSGVDGWTAWTQVDNFAQSGAEDEHWRLDAHEGAIVFGSAVREAQGNLRFHGMAPPAGSHVRVRQYRTGGGRAGNVAAHEVVTLTSAVPFVGRVDNRHSGTGGVDGETLDQAKVRGPLVLGTRNRAVTAEDYEQLARESTPEVARVRCIPVDDDADPVDDDLDSAGVRVLLVPAVAADAQGRLRFEQLVPTDEMSDRVRGYLDTRRMIGARVQITPPRYLGVTVIARLRARPNVDADELRRRAVMAVYEYFDPLRGGPDGTGWPFGRPVLLGEVFSVMQRLDGIDLVEDARLFPADPISGERGDAVNRIDLDADALVFSYGHQIQVLD
jgi:predicted phage baseplate assembly protein